MNRVEHNPDILTCLANLSNDEVFTPPEVAQQMLDTLPQELFSNPDTKFLDPFSKSGVFLREIAKRLIGGLEDKIPNLQERVNHIMQNQIYGIGITELTALLARRTLYCSKDSNGIHSATNIFENKEGNIAFDAISHTWDNNEKCIYCGANQNSLGEDEREDLETHAYQFIHNQNPFEDMQFDVIIGNPPYQLGVGNKGGNSSKAKAIYHLFIEQAIKMKPHYLCMIVPSRWMTRSTEGIPKKWVDEMINSNHFKEIHDFLNAEGIFSGTPPKGGVNYFLWDSKYNGKCDYYLYKNSDDSKPYYESKILNKNNLDIVIRDEFANEILDKIVKVENDYANKENFSDLVSPKDFFTNKKFLTSSWNGFKLIPKRDYNIKYYPNKNHLNDNMDFGWISIHQIPKNREVKDLHKVYIPAAGGSGTDAQILGYPFYGEPNSVCSQTYLVIGYDLVKHKFTKEQCFNIITYIKTRFFRYLVSIKKKTQNGARGVYQFVPIQNFDEEWTDEKLYKKYGLSQEEIDYIESMVRPME